MYIITVRRITSGELFKQRKGFCIRRSYGSPSQISNQFALTLPIGVNTGYCNVGNFGSADRLDYTIIGGQVNLAARLEGIAEPDGIMLSYETYALVQEAVVAVEGEAVQVKGISRPVRTFALTGISDGPSMNLDLDGKQ